MRLIYLRKRAFPITVGRRVRRVDPYVEKTPARGGGIVIRILVHILAVSLIAGPVYAQGPGGPVQDDQAVRSVQADQAVQAVQAVRMTLEQCVDRALRVSPDIEQAVLTVEGLEARLSEARFAGITPRLQWTNIFGPAPGIEGDTEKIETIRSDLTDLGVFSRTQIELVQPLYTFGKLSNAKKAAGYGLEAGEAAVESRKFDVAFQVKRLFYGLVLAGELRDIILDSVEKVQEARDRVNEMIEEDSEDVGQNDLLKIDVFEFEVQQSRARAEKSIEMGRAALKALLELDRSVDFDIVHRAAETETADLEELDVYIERAKNRRYDIRQLRAGVLARRALLKVARSDFYPQIALAGSLQWGIAPHRPELDNPFLRDEFNFLRGGAVITLRQNFNFGLTRAKYLARKVELEALVSKESQAMSAVALQVEQTYRDVIEARTNVDNSDRALRSARAWLTSAQLGFDVTGDSSELLDAFTAHAKMQHAHRQSMYQYRVSLAELDHVTGNGIYSGRR